LSVDELVHVISRPQSTVSRHLKPLREAGLVETRRDGTSVFYRLGPAFQQGEFSDFLSSRLADFPSAESDRLAVRKALEERRKRSREFFDQIAGEYNALTEPGGGWPVLTAALASGFRGKQVADLGAGEGMLTLLLARFATKVTVVDHSASMLTYVKAKAEAKGVADRIELVEGDLESLPLADASMDAVFLSQSLHHAARPDVAITEASRVLVPGGQLVVLDLVEHQHEWAREQWADQWLGFTPRDLEQWISAAGIDVESLESLDGSTPDLPILFCVGFKKNK